MITIALIHLVRSLKGGFPDWRNPEMANFCKAENANPQFFEAEIGIQTWAKAEILGKLRRRKSEIAILFFLLQLNLAEPLKNYWITLFLITAEPGWTTEYAFGIWESVWWRWQRNLPPFQLNRNGFLYSSSIYDHHKIWNLIFRRMCFKCFSRRFRGFSNHFVLGAWKFVRISSYFQY